MQSYKSIPLAAIVLALCQAVAPVAAAAQTVSDRYEFNIERQSLDAALKDFAQQTGLQIARFSDAVDGAVTVGPLAGRYSVEQALTSLLGPQGLGYQRVNDRTIAVLPRSQADAPVEHTAVPRERDAGDHGMARGTTDAADILQIAQAEQTRSAVAAPPRDEAGSGERENSTSESASTTVIVTGSRIAGATSQLAANVIVLDAEALRATGRTTLEGVLKQLPQNIFGATEVGAALGNSGMSFNGAINITGGSSINLRGLGSESTLVLIDGRRIGKSGVFGGVSDISGIPLRSIERVEIMLDGASAIYGSDAVGGVVNIILKKDFEGTEATYEYGAPQQGGFDEHIATIAGGFSWGSGRLRATAEYFQRGNLDGADRPERVGRSTGSNPATFSVPFNTGPLFYQLNGENYLPSELAAAGFTPASPGVQQVRMAAFAEGRGGSDWTVDDLIPRPTFQALTDENASDGISLIPAQERSTIQLGFDQDIRLLGAPATLSGSLYFSQRDTYAANGSFVFSSRIAANHPSNPFEANANVNWRIPQFADVHHETDQRVARWSLSLDSADLWGWRWSLSAGQSRDEIDSSYFNESIAGFGNTPELNAALAAGLDLFAFDIEAENSPDLLRTLVRADPRRTLAINEEDRVEVSISRSLFRLPGGEVHLAIGADWREERLDTGSESFLGSVVASGVTNSGPALPFDRTMASRLQRAAFTEILVPLVGAANARPAVQRLTLTGAARYDSYNVYGSDTTWSLGAIWSPIESVAFKVNRSTSFVVPTPRDGLIPKDMFDFLDFGGLPWPLTDVNGIPNGETVDIGVFVEGGNPDLTPETAVSTSAGIEITPAFLPGLRFSATWHATDYRNRIGPSPEIAWISGTDFVARYPNISLHESGTLIWDLRPVNHAVVEAEGIDYQLIYNGQTAYGQFVMSANVGYTSKYERSLLPGDPPVNEVADVNFQSQAVIPRYRYRTNLGWHRHGLSINLDVSTASKTVSRGLSVLETGTVKRIGNPAVLADLILNYDFDLGAGGALPVWLRGSAVSLKILNLLDDHPQYSIVNEGTGAPGPSELNANLADPRGRMLYLGLTRRF